MIRRPRDLHSFQTLKHYNPILGADADTAGVHKGIFLQDESHGVGQFIVVVFLRGNLFQSVDDGAGAGDPPCEDTGESFMTQAGHFAVESDDAVFNFDHDGPARLRSSLSDRYNRTGQATDQASLECRLFEYKMVAGGMRQKKLEE